MASNLLQNDDLLIQIRDKLRKDDVKLWLLPYYSETDGTSEEQIIKLSETVGEALERPAEECRPIIEQLQKSSLEKIEQKACYEESGLATLKIRILREGQPPQTLIKKLMLTSKGSELRDIICQEVSAAAADKVKLVCSGRILNDQDVLESQGVKNGTLIMAITTSESAQQMLQEVEWRQKQIKELEMLKDDAQLLAMEDNNYVRLEDQFGKSFQIPQVERTNLTLAIRFHQKGRLSLNRQDFSTALFYLLEADQQFGDCSRELLTTIDNYALLDLDVAWCYLCLQSLTQLPEAEERLKRCQQVLERTYGPNMERVIARKGTAGSTGIEACHVMRLHLLLGIVLYHKNKRAQSLELLKIVQIELNALKVNEGSLAALQELGYLKTDAILALRATAGDVNLAANHIAEIGRKRFQNRQEAVLEKEKKKLGKCADGEQYVDPNFLNCLVKMGYNKEIALTALKICNNVIIDSVEYIKENPLPGPSASGSSKFQSGIENLVELGFDPTMARKALRKHHGDVKGATEDLKDNDGEVYENMSDLSDLSDGEDFDEEDDDKKTQEAFKRLKEECLVDDDHFDLDLVQEEKFLNQYLSFLEK